MLKLMGKIFLHFTLKKVCLSKPMHVSIYFAVTSIFRRAFINCESLWRLIIDLVGIFIGTGIHEYLILNKGSDQF